MLQALMQQVWRTRQPVSYTHLDVYKRQGTTNGTITGLDGDFSLSNVKKGDIIQISFVGYQTQEIKWNGQPIDVTLKDDTQQLGEVRCV